MSNAIKSESLNQKIKKSLHSLQYLPVGLFGSTVAIAGLAIAFKQAKSIFGFPEFLGVIIAKLGWFVFLLLTFFYALKFIVFPLKVKEELKHPVQANFLGTFFISAVLLAGLAVPYSID